MVPRLEGVNWFGKSQDGQPLVFGFYKRELGALPPTEVKYLQIIAMLILKRKEKSTFSAASSSKGPCQSLAGLRSNPIKCAVLGMPAKLSLFLLLSDILAGFHGVTLDALVMPFAKHWAKAQGGTGGGGLPHPTTAGCKGNGRCLQVRNEGSRRGVCASPFRVKKQHVAFITASGLAQEKQLVPLFHSEEKGV